VFVAALFDASKGSPVLGGLIVVGALVVLAVCWLVDTARFPNRSCSCRGGRSYSKLRPGAWGEHRACGGRGYKARVR
jgi:hypothetical protein